MLADFLGLLLADGRLPTGAHTQSAGLEPAFLGGMRLDQVPDYLAVRLATVTEVEAATAVVTRHVWLTTEPGRRSGALVPVDAAWRARTTSDAVREANDLLGRSLRRTAGAVWDLDDLGAPRAPWCRAVVLGATAATVGLTAAATARLVGFEEVQTVVAAALKLRPFDPALGVRWAAAAGPGLEAMVGRVAPLIVPEEIPAWAAPQIEHWAQAHRDAERRLFRA